MHVPKLATTRHPRHPDCRCQEIAPTPQRTARCWITTQRRACKHAARQSLKRILRAEAAPYL